MTALVDDISVIWGPNNERERERVIKGLFIFQDFEGRYTIKLQKMNEICPKDIKQCISNEVDTYFIL